MNHKHSQLSISFLPTEPVGSIPRPEELIAKLEQFKNGTLSHAQLALAEAVAVNDTIAQFEATGRPSSPTASNANKISSSILCAALPTSQPGTSA